MQILHLIHQYLPEKIGGTELYTRTLMRHQVAQGDSVALFTPSQTQEPSIEKGMQIYRVPIGERTATAVFQSNFRQPELETAFAQTLEKENPDVVHIQHLMGLPFNIASHIQKADIPYLVTLHDYWYLCANAQLLTNYDETVCAGPTYWLNCARCALARAGHKNALPLIPALAPLFGWRHGRLHSILQQAQTLIAPTQFTATIYQQMGIAADKIEIIPHGIAPPAQMPPRPRQKEFLIGYIGGISSQKGVHVLIEAVNQLTDLDVQLTIYGDLTAFPDYAAQLQAQVSHPQIYLAGRLPHEALWRGLAGFDLLVVPTLWYETASLIVQEAFAARVPVVASNIGVMPERVQDGVDGRLFPPGDVSALAAILRHLATDREALAQLQDNIQPVFTIDEHVKAVTAVYQNALSK